MKSEEYHFLNSIVLVLLGVGFIAIENLYDTICYQLDMTLTTIPFENNHMGNLIRGMHYHLLQVRHQPSPDYLFRIHARAAIFAILIGSGIEPWRVKELTIVDASFKLIPQYLMNRLLPVFNRILSR